MVLGMTGLVLTRILLGGVFAAGATYLVEDIKEKKGTETEGGEAGEMLILNEWETLFHQLGIIKAEKGERVEEVGREEKTCYTLTTLKGSTGVKVANIQKQLDTLRIKLNAPRLEVDGKGDEIYIKELKTHVAPKYFKIESGAPSHLIKIGVDDENEVVEWDLTKDPNMVLGGSPGCGKSCLLNMIILQILAAAKTELFLVDLKAGIEFGVYEGLEKVRRYEESEERTKQMINGLLMEMKWRLDAIKAAGCKNYEELLAKEPDTELNRLFLVIDECGDLQSAENQGINKDIFARAKEKAAAEKIDPKKKVVKEFDVIGDLKELSRKGRAAGIHIILATQRHTADSIDPSTKNNCTAIVGMRVMNEHNSELIINRKGLERLEKREAIAVLGGEEKHIRTMYLEETYLKEFLQKQERR